MKDRSKYNQTKDRQRPKTLGPVPHLEEHVNPKWWKKIFKSLYLMKDADTVEDASITKMEVYLVFNLCDEGYNNDPKKELHVPAMLEMLNIPYTVS